MTTIRPLTGDGSPPVEGAYPQAVEVSGASRWLYISGQIPVAPDGSLSPDFTTQCRQCWANIETQLAAADMTKDNLVKVTTFLSDRRYALENRAVRVDRVENGDLAFTTDVGDVVVADADHPIRVEAGADGQPAPCILVRAGLEARIARPVFYELVEMAEREGHQLRVRSGGRWWSLGRLEGAA